MKEKNGWIKEILFQLILVISASLLFTLSFPNPVFNNGLPFLAWFCYIPMLLVIQKNGFLPCLGWGAVYGLSAYFLFNHWLITFHPAAGAVVYSVYLFYLAVLFLLFRFSILLFPKKYYIVQWIIWLGYEYLRTLGFLGYPYGITGYSQWRIIPLIQIAGITGVWGVSALVTFPSFFIAAALKDLSFKNVKRQAAAVLKAFLKRELIPACLFLAALTAALIFGFTRNVDFSGSPSVKIALIQHNSDPWEAHNFSTSWQIHDAYRKDFTILRELSQKAIADEPELDLVVWPETAFVPRIYWHSTYRDNQDLWNIVKDLLEYLSGKEIPFLIGNDDTRMDPEKNPNARENFQVSYNSALLFKRGEIAEIYRKNHLVPFTEHFPYKKQFPVIYDLLLEEDTHFWEKGNEQTIFKLPGFSFAAPICFEDAFGYISRNFVLNGADVLVNLTNDAWAKSLSAQNQHLSTSVFRAVENHRPMVRSTVSGQTCAIDPSGRVISISPAFTQSFLNVSVPLVGKKTFYTLYGDYLGITFAAAAIILLLSGSIWYIIGKYKKE